MWSGFMDGWMDSIQMDGHSYIYLTANNKHSVYFKI